MVERVFLAAHHQAVAVGEAPDPARSSCVHVVHALRPDPRGIPHGDLPVGVAAVDDDVARVAERRELIDGLGRGIAGGDPPPPPPPPGLKTLCRAIHRERPDPPPRGLPPDSARPAAHARRARPLPPPPPRPAPPPPP